MFLQRNKHTPYLMLPHEHQRNSLMSLKRGRAVGAAREINRRRTRFPPADYG